MLEVNNLKKYFHISKNQLLKAVDGVSFSVEKGKTLGLVGESGCGKTTVGRTIIRLYDADGGKVLFKGKEIHKLNKSQYKEFTKEMQMIFQDPYSSLNPRKTVEAIVGEGLDIHKLYSSKEERRKRIYELLDMVGLNKEHANRFPHEFSGGQRQRIGIARALSVNPEFIVCDEAISALDVSIQAQIINLLINLQKELNLTYLFIAHDLSMVRYISDEVAVMYLGKIVEKTDSEDLFLNPMHPYTKGLIRAVPMPDPESERNRVHDLLAGEVPSPLNPPEGCRFYKRCSFRKEICNLQEPTLKAIGNNHLVACHMVHSLSW
ncbi:MAG: ABC transporter ATP-binding protein [Tissierellia bacterium]|nr:ABC transporter ATP-binding protein [Tissierellia bacterium]